MIDKQAGTVSRSGLIVVVIVCFVLGLAAMLLPKGFSDDLSKIGQGMAVIVLTHDKNSVRSMELMSLLNKIRADYKGTIEFMAVDIDSREGQIFSQRQGVDGIMLILFDATGGRQLVFDRSVSEMDLRFALDAL